jgi:hypothetical protein
MTLTCYCCHRPYERGHFRCCAAPPGMTSQVWLESWCREPIGEGRDCNSCPRCGCAHRPPQVLSGLGLEMATPADLAPKTRGAFKALVKEWMPFREHREPGEDG